MGRMLMALQELSLSHAEAAFRRQFIPGTDHAFEPSLRDGASLPLYPGTPGYYRGVPPGQKPSAIQPRVYPRGATCCPDPLRLYNRRRPRPRLRMGADYGDGREFRSYHLETAQNGDNVKIEPN